MPISPEIAKLMDLCEEGRPGAFGSSPRGDRQRPTFARSARSA